MTKDFLLRLTEEHYGAGALPVYRRLLEEQRLTRGGPLLPMWHCTATLRRAFGGENVLVLGCTNDSLLAHLLGATPVNPLPPHYHCPNCHRLIFDAHADDGWDLPDLACPECGAPMAADGHNLRSRSLIGESVVSLQVPQERFAPVCAWLRDYWAQRDCQTDTEPYSDAEVMGLRLTLPEGTISPVVSTKNTATGSFAFPRLSDISRMLQSMFEVRVLYPTDRLDPLPADVPPLHTAYRHIKGMGLRLASGAWTGAERDAVERGRMAFEDVLTFREDVYDLLRQHTPPKQRRENGLPWAISEEVRKGKYAAQGMPKLIENYLRKQLRVPAHYIEAMKHIRYLPRKGDCVG